jgi:transketolase
MITTHVVPVGEFHRVRDAARLDAFERLALIADMCRLNTLNAVKRAGSGHLGSSFSAMDLMVLLYYRVMSVQREGVDHADRDVFLSSKGHDVPAQYSILYSLGIVPPDKLLRLRRLGGLEGHPSVDVPGIESNTGSLGMGISKGRGMAVGKRLRGRGGQVYVLTGDGEFQEGQIFEALQTTAHQRVGLTVIIDHNTLQSDKPVREITDLRDLEAKVAAFGWRVERCDGHDLRRLDEVLARFRGMGEQPRLLIADTIKGRGVSFMEHPVALVDGKGLYRWHAGAPDDESFVRAHEELLGRVNERFTTSGIGRLRLEPIPAEGKQPARVSEEYVVEAFGDALVALGARHPEIVVLDGDLAADCRIRKFEYAYPERFIENGIAEQDMVSMAGGLARQGLLPVVNSFGAFLAARANEQIYNNCSERSKVIYVCHLAGIIPAGPGKSHQSVRDISLFRALPNCTIIEPCSAVETEQALEYCVECASQSCMLRLAIGPSPRVIPLPSAYRLTWGRGTVLADGADVLAFGYGPVLLHELLTAADGLRERGVGVRVVNLPWLNQVDGEWLEAVVQQFSAIVVVENHSPEGGLGDTLLGALAGRDALRGRRVWKVGVEGYPVCGSPPEVLRHHRLDAGSLAEVLLAAARAAGQAGPATVPLHLQAAEADTPIG